MNSEKNVRRTLERTESQDVLRLRRELAQRNEEYVQLEAQCKLLEQHVAAQRKTIDAQEDALSRLKMAVATLQRQMATVMERFPGRRKG